MIRLCPDCKSMMDYISTMCSEIGDVRCEGYYKCPKCKIEIEDDEEGER